MPIHVNATSQPTPWLALNLTTDETIVGTSGNDTLTGTSGDDQIQGLGGDDILVGLAGNDTLEGQLGNDTLSGGSGDNVIDGGKGFDYVNYRSEGPVNISGRLVEAAVGTDHLINIDGFLLGSGDDTIAGTKRSEVFNDDGGNNFVDAQQGNDEITVHGSGNNTLLGGLGDDTITGGSGNDLITDAGGNESVDAGAGNDTIDTGSGIDSIDGGEGDDILTAYGFGHLEGGAGFDTLDYSRSVAAFLVDLELGTVNGGNQTVAGIEAVIGSMANDTLMAGSGGSSLDGNDGNDRIIGGSGDDTLIGGSGRDLLSGGAGQDLLTGGSGADKFQFLSPADSTGEAIDQISDLTDDDVIDLRRIDADTTSPHNQAFTIVSSFSGHAGQLVLTYNSDTNSTSLEGDTNGDGLADFSVSIAGNHSDFTNLLL